MDRLADTGAVVVGGGFGGLSTACHLADRGADVTLVEKNEQLGGRASTLERDGFRFDMGPSWYLMPDVYERFFGRFGREPGEFYDLERLDPQYRVFFEDGDRFDATGDPDGTAARFEAYESGAGEAFERYLARSRETYEVGMERFVYEDRSRLREFLSLDVLRSAHGLPLLRTMADHVGRYFEHPKLRQLVQYPLVFLGGSPYNTPALYSLLTHVDVNLGVHYPGGGMGGVVDAVVDLARDLGVETRVGSEATSIEPAGSAGGTGAGGLRVEAGDSTHRADCVVSDAGYAHTERDLLADPHRQYDDDYWASRTLAPSAFLCYLGVEGDLAPLAHHNLVFPSDWDPHFERIFDDPAWPEDPAYYVCAPSRTDDAVAPDGHGNLFVLVPIAPGLPDGPEIRERFADRVLADLAGKTGVDVRDRVVVSETFCVSEFAERYNSPRGTALGLAHTLRQTAPFRPPHRSAALDGLYFVGADTTPGVGVPMCLISGELTADYVAEDVGP